MSRYLSTHGNSKCAIAICGRCSTKIAYDDLLEDPNAPGLMVCHECCDEFDPWRLPGRQAEDISLQHPRPDVFLSVGPQTIVLNPLQAKLADERGVPVVDDYGNPIVFDRPANPLYPPVPWSANAFYTPGQQVTEANAIGFDAVGKQVWLFTCIVGGQSGSSAPVWAEQQGVTIQDNSVLWINTGLYLP